MKFLIDECLHTSLVAVAERHGHEAGHVNWLGLSGETDWGLMPRILKEDFTLVTNNARDFRRLHAQQPVHAGLVILIPQVAPARQRELFDTFLAKLNPDEFLVNEAIEIEIEDETVIVTRYQLSADGAV